MTRKSSRRWKQHEGDITIRHRAGLDTTPLGLVTQRPGHIGGDVCKVWYACLTRIGCRFFVPEIADYESRREFLRHGTRIAVTRLGIFSTAVADRYLPLTTQEVRLAADLWARVRNQGKTTAPPEALDGDALIAAQASLLNPAAFGLATVAVLWSDIRA